MQISDGGEKAESQAKAFSAVSVSAAQDTESFEDSQHVFDTNAA